MLREVLGGIPSLYRLANRVRRYRIHEPEINIGYEFIGSWYGGWPLPDGVLKAESIVYSFGLGEDISFDLGVIAKADCSVHGFDPTPIATSWLELQTIPDKFIFHHAGLAESDGEMEFFPPQDGHSFSRKPADGDTSITIKCPVRRLGSIMADLGHDHIDLLKMDIEGFEYAVIQDFLASDIRPTVINIEFHHKSFDIPLSETQTAVLSLQKAGYRIYWVSDLGREYGFIRDEHSRA